ELETTPGTRGVDATKVYMEITPDEDPRATEPDEGSTADGDGSDDDGGRSGGGFEIVGIGPGGSRGGSGPRLGPLNGQSVKITIAVRSSGGAVLAVPTPAVSAAADGTSRVEVEDSPGRPTRFVTVTVGLAAEGLVAVTPVAGKLEEGMQVVIGSE